MDIYNTEIQFPDSIKQKYRNWRMLCPVYVYLEDGSEYIGPLTDEYFEGFVLDENTLSFNRKLK